MRVTANAMLALAAIAVVAFFGSEVWNFANGLISPKAERPIEEPHLTTYEGMSNKAIGAAVLEAQGCLSCHQRDLKGGIVGPSFSNVGVRWSNPERLRTQIVAAHELYPGTYMPSFQHLTEQEVDGLIAYLGTFNSQREGPANTGEAQIQIPTDDQGDPRFSEAMVERGQQLYGQQGCVGCHHINGIAPGGNQGPNLTHEGKRGRSYEWQIRHLKGPLDVYVEGEPQGNWQMPSYSQLPEKDLKALAAFLQSLR
ncbi:MAG: cytochrome c [Candidatus Bipolaricaulia bacterium]